MRDNILSENVTYDLQHKCVREAYKNEACEDRGVDQWLSQIYKQNFQTLDWSSSYLDPSAIVRRLNLSTGNQKLIFSVIINNQ